jgi:uroporphyrinogen-III synthase
VLALVRVGAAVNPGQAQALVATSAHAFEAISADEASSLAHLPLFVVGARTAEAAERVGLAAPRVTAAQVSGLAAQMGPALPTGAKLLYLAGRDRKPDLEEALADQGFEIAAAVVYEAQALQDLSQDVAAALRRGEAQAVLHFSRRSAQLFLNCAARAGLSDEAARLRHICISQDAATPLGPGAIVATTPDSAGLFEALEEI